MDPHRSNDDALKSSCSRVGYAVGEIWAIFGIPVQVTLIHQSGILWLDHLTLFGEQLYFIVAQRSTFYHQVHLLSRLVFDWAVMDPSRCDIKTTNEKCIKFSLHPSPPIRLGLPPFIRRHLVLRPLRGVCTCCLPFNWYDDVLPEGIIKQTNLTTTQFFVLEHTKKSDAKWAECKLLLSHKLRFYVFFWLCLFLIKFNL